MTTSGGAGHLFDTAVADGYRALSRAALTRSLPLTEPRRYLYDLVQQSLGDSRPSLAAAVCLASCGTLGGHLDRAADAAAAFDVLHAGLRAHDDLGGTPARSDAAPLVRAHGVPLTLNAGDAMQALCLRLLRNNFGTLDDAVAWRIIDEFNRAHVAALEGRAIQVAWFRDGLPDLAEADYLQMLSPSCLSQFVHPCRVGALIGRGADVDLAPLSEFAYVLGAAMRLQQDAAAMRAPLGGVECLFRDDGSPTLALSHLMTHAADPERQRLRELLQRGPGRRLARAMTWVSDLMRELGSVEYVGANRATFAGAAASAFEKAIGGASGTHADFLAQLLRQASAS